MSRAVELLLTQLVLPTAQGMVLTSEAHEAGGLRESLINKGSYKDKRLEIRTRPPICRVRLRSDSFLFLSKLQEDQSQGSHLWL